MDAICVRFYTREGQRQDGQPIHDWLFTQARRSGFSGGTALRAHAGFGRHGLHEDSFFELAGGLPQVVEFFGPAEQVEALIAAVGAAGLALPYVAHPVRHGVTGQKG